LRIFQNRKYERKSAKNFLDMQIALRENHEHIHWFASIPKVAIMHARLLRSSAKNRLKSSAVRKTRKAIFESLEHKHLMAIDSIIGVDPSRTLDLPPDYSPTESANLRSNATDARNRATRLADSLIPGSGDPNAPYSSQTDASWRCRQAIRDFGCRSG
jgi:hypothetical protein